MTDKNELDKKAERLLAFQHWYDMSGGHIADDVLSDACDLARACKVASPESNAEMVEGDG